MRILVIDPDEYYHTKLQSMLADLGELTIWRDVDSARETLRHTKPDVVISELLFSDSTGYEILQYWENGKDRAKPLVFIFSKVGNEDDQNQALKMGAERFFVKGRDTLNDIRDAILININKVYERV